jgi:serine/threonine protein kinase
MNDVKADAKAIFLQALECQAPEQMHRLLDDACNGDTALRARAEELLRAHREAGNFLGGSRPLDATLDAPPGEGPGTVIGPYKLLEQIGEGGMGLVFMAEQTRPVRRRVALKVLKPGMDTRQVVARFEAERQALALMDHPNIARIHDGGTTESGRPYFVMELVRGVPITEFCDQRRLTTRQRLELFATVCQAVQHAHQKGVIHRDLKPSNVLVTLHDTVAVPKVIDFGIAKATSQPLTERTLFTQFAQMIGTPLYMSPEQAEMNGLDVDTRSDVYALGVLLYELLTGTTPFTGETLKKAGLDEMRRIIREEEPPMPSQRLSTLEAKACSTVSERRGVDGRRLRQLLRSELDWIVMKALEKDRDRRYESASALASDVQRYLNDDTVEACPPSAGYRLRKYWRRNRRALVVAGVFATVLVAAMAISIWQAVNARIAQRRAEAAESQAATEAAIAQAVNAFLQEDLLGQVANAPPDWQPGEARVLTVKEALDQAAARIGDRFQDQPLVEAAIRMAIGNAYNNLFDFPHAVHQMERALELRKALLGPDHSDTLESMKQLANVYSWLGSHSESIALREQAVKSSSAVLGPDHPETRRRLLQLAWGYEFAGHLERSVPLKKQLLEYERTHEGPTHPATLAAMQSLAWDYGLMGRLEESMALFEKSVALQNTGFGQEMLLMRYASVCQWAGKCDKVEQLLRDAIKNRNPYYGQVGERNNAANLLGFLALNLLLQGRYDQAEPIAREAVAMNRTGDFKFNFWVGVLGAVRLGQGKYAEAEPLLLKGYDGMKHVEGINLHAKKRTTEIGEWIIRLYEATNQPEKARLWRGKLEAVSQAAAQPK